MFNVRAKAGSAARCRSEKEKKTVGEASGGHCSPVMMQLGFLLCPPSFLHKSCLVPSIIIHPNLTPSSWVASFVPPPDKWRRQNMHPPKGEKVESKRERERADVRFGDERSHPNMIMIEGSTATNPGPVRLMPWLDARPRRRTVVLHWETSQALSPP
ncbi:hypothetical protein PDE_09472 [Penicillium oxalicum 114-2]|uniref:Uncharacterized protein n=1 Tax=Penicillium oxalicum (strain 114-2 / CGMCC 5302) TaxID=933388 RepID=S8B6I7_PENO1|nr:hypothetical protein PDE_09472 [Penicillium oxalicum 114-2]